MDRFSRVLVATLAVALVAVTSALFLAARVSRRNPLGENGLGNPPGMSDRLDLVETVEAWERGRREHVIVRNGQPPALVLDAPAKKYPRAGRWTSAEVVTAFAFTELLPSWNVSAPAETGLRLEARVRNARRHTWSPWLYFGSWGRTPSGAERVVTCTQGVVDVDYLALKSPADAYQLRVEFTSFSLDNTAAPSVRRVAVSYSGVTGERRPTVQSIDGWVRDLKVPFRCQKDEHKALRGEICSATSVTMVLAYWSVDRPVAENSLAIWDDRNEMFGN